MNMNEYEFLGFVAVCACTVAHIGDIGFQKA